jgi:hypothetical protein
VRRFGLPPWPDGAGLFLGLRVFTVIMHLWWRPTIVKIDDSL